MASSFAHTGTYAPCERGRYPCWYVRLSADKDVHILFRVHILFAPKAGRVSLVARRAAFLAPSRVLARKASNVIGVATFTAVYARSRMVACVAPVLVLRNDEIRCTQRTLCGILQVGSNRSNGSFGARVARPFLFRTTVRCQPPFLRSVALVALHFFQRRFHLVQRALRDQTIFRNANGTEHHPIQIQLDHAHVDALRFAASALNHFATVAVLVFPADAVVNVFAMVLFDEIVKLVVRAGSRQL